MSDPAPLASIGAQKVYILFAVEKTKLFDPIRIGNIGVFEYLHDAINLAHEVADKVRTIPSLLYHTHPSPLPSSPSPVSTSHLTKGPLT